MVSAWAVGAAALVGALVVAQPGFAGTRTDGAVALEGVTWIEGLDRAAARASKLGRPFLHLQMMGRLDDEFC
jgi:hypothetical protein